MVLQNAVFCIFSVSSCRSIHWGFQTELSYSRSGSTSPLYADSLTSCRHADKHHLRKPKVLLAFVQMLLTCVPSQIISNSNAKIFDIFYFSNDSSL